MIIHQSFCQSRVATTFPWIFLRCCWPNSLFETSSWLFQKTAKNDFFHHYSTTKERAILMFDPSHCNFQGGARCLVLRTREIGTPGIPRHPNFSQSAGQELFALIIETKLIITILIFILIILTHIVIKTLPDSPSMSYLQDKYFFCSLLWSAPGS